MKLIGPFTQLIPFQNTPLRGAIKDDTLEIIAQGGIVADNEKIIDIGLFEDLKRRFANSSIQVEEIIGDMVAIPGLIDSHTHICFSGSRANDYSARNNGKTYQEIASQGGGIWQTVQSVRNASQQELEQNIIHRANIMLKNGITTLEIKSGYGLALDDELKMLRSIQKAKSQVVQDVIPTCLSAHILPKDFHGNNVPYLEFIVTKILPIVKSEKLSQRVDIFVEKNAFGVEEAKKFLTKAKHLGFDICIHGDQFSVGGSTLAVELEALSVDHLEASTQKEVDVLAKSNVVCNLLPAASLGLGMPFAPARKLLDTGTIVSIASDWNPGSAPMGDLLISASLMGAYEKLSFSEVFSGLTFRAAQALKLNNYGRLMQGYFADFICFSTHNYQEILYAQGMLKPSHVWKKGTQIF